MQIVSSFYKYVEIENPEELSQEQIELCTSLGIVGRILIGNEGINGSVCGNENSIQIYKKELASIHFFKDIEFKDFETKKMAFKRLYVSVRKEIVHFGAKVDLKRTGTFITPTELKEMLDNKEDVVLVDMRNDYESRIGRFKNARTLNMKKFRDLPNALKEIEDLKDKKVVTYCTGGIRCEKASAFLKENGFNEVSQIKGGILNFAKEFPDTYWEGNCFVFDDRLTISLNKDAEPLNQCQWCEYKTEGYVNCHNLDCDKLFVCCDECKTSHNASCSTKCETSNKRRTKNIAVIN